MSYSDILEHFHSAILENNSTIAAPDIKPGGHPEVYIEGYRMRLSQAVRTDYPALLNIIGEQQFNQLAFDFIEANPSCSYNLDRYPHPFGAFAISKLGNAFAREVAHLEGAIARVFMGEESEPLELSILSHLTPESFAGMTLKPRQASDLVSYNSPVSEWLDAWKKNNNAPEPLLKEEFVYIYRHNNKVQRVQLSETAYEFLKQLFNEKTMEEALKHTITAQSHNEAQILENIQTWFAGWLAKGFFRKA